MKSKIALELTNLWKKYLELDSKSKANDEINQWFNNLRFDKKIKIYEIFGLIIFIGNLENLVKIINMIKKEI